ncbi:MAG TPA: lactate racemase domain-containing protein [Gaiellaceae bacterium]|nr:lactate racemase domain-containing protein [Gaiellaceae bacterium]
MPRIPILSGSRVAVVNVPDDALVLRPRPPSEAIADVGAAVRDALRFPLSGAPLEALVTTGGKATIVVEPPELPLPGAPNDPRQEALATTIAELERLGVPSRQQTILIAGGLNRRAGQRELEALVSPSSARRFHGRVEVHDVEADDLIHLATDAGRPLRVNRLLAETDLVVCVTAAETVLHGGPGALVGACGAETLRASTAYSLLETAAARGWQLGLTLERALSARVPVIGASLVLNPPRLQGRFRGYPYEDASLSHLARSPLRRYSLLPAGWRRRILQDLSRELTAVAAFAGPPSVAHAEALLRGIARRATRLEQPVDALVIGMPWKHQHSPRERLNPLTVATAALGLALRLWRDAFPIVEGGTAIVLHRLGRHFEHRTQDPYRALFHALRDGRTSSDLAAAERAAAADERALAAYRSGRACHPLLPYADWDSCRPALGRLGAVVIAGCRDHQAARTLGFVPTHGIPSALEMAHGRAGGQARIGYLLAPPYFPLEVGAA